VADMAGMVMVSLSHMVNSLSNLSGTSKVRLSVVDMVARHKIVVTGAISEDQAGTSCISRLRSRLNILERDGFAYQWACYKVQPHRRGTYLIAQHVRHGEASYLPMCGQYTLSALLCSILTSLR
jgi:hypothetical protein